MTSPITRGDLEPDLECTIGDLDGDADFTSVTPSQVRVIGWLNGQKLWELQPESVTPSADGKTAVLRRSWATGETDTAGKVFIKARVMWPGDRPQHFPGEGYMVLEILKDPDDT